MECASRRRKEALVETLADLMLEHTGVPLERERAMVIADGCVKTYHTTISYHIMALGYVYQEQAKVWQRHNLLKG